MTNQEEAIELSALMTVAMRMYKVGCGTGGRVMTEQEAIKDLSALMTREPAFAVALDMAIFALEKQIPKKPNRTQSKNSENLWDLYCPSCVNWIGIWNSRLERGDMHNTSNGNICPCCGQAIDWEDGE